MKRLRPLFTSGLALVILAVAACVRTPMTPEDSDSDDEPGDGDSVFVNLVEDTAAPADLLEDRTIIILERHDR